MPSQGSSTPSMDNQHGILTRWLLAGFLATVTLLLAAGCGNSESDQSTGAGGSASELGGTIYTSPPGSTRVTASGVADEAPGMTGLGRALARIRQETAGRPYHIQPAGGAHVADNPAHGLSVYFDGAGVEFRGSGTGWRATLRLERWGRSQGTIRRAQRSQVLARDNRLIYGRAGGLEEWYVNGPDGLEHGFNIKERPDGAVGPLVLELKLAGTVEVRGGGKRITLHRLDGQAVAVYGGLWVEDASGREVPSRMVVSGEKLIIEVQDAGATYPLVVDPLIQSMAKVTASDGTGGDIFGFAVAVYGDTAVVGAEKDDDLGINSGSAYVLVAKGNSWSQLQKLTASDGSVGDKFGTSVSIHAKKILVGAGGQDDAGTDSGAAYVFIRNGNTWSQQTKLTAPDAAAFDEFGHSVSISGGTALVGSWLDDPKGANSGSAYVFSRSGNSWSMQAKLSASDGAVLDEFGGAVSVTPGVAVVSSQKDDDLGSDSGSAYVFVRSGIKWNQQAKLTAADGAAWDEFGGSLSSVGDTVIVGANKDDDRGNDSGSAYLFSRTGAIWIQQQKLTAPDGAGGDYFGAAVAISGEAALVGAYWDDDRGGNSGSAYLYSRSGTTWSQKAKLTAPDGTATDHFGQAVAISGDVDIVGAYWDDDKGADSGSVYLSRLCFKETWELQAKLTATGGSPGDLHAAAVSLSGESSLVGVPGDDDRGSGSGSAHVYSRGATTWAQQGKLTAADGAADDGFGVSTALSVDTALVGAPDDDDRGSGSGSAYLFARTGTTWAQQGKLTAADGAASDAFGAAADLTADMALVGAPLDDFGLHTDAGAGYIFVRSGTTWSQQAKLTAAVAPGNGSSGAAVSLSGTTALVGAPKADQRGSGYVFVRSGASWSQQAKLTSSDLQAADMLGSAVSLDGDLALVGAPDDDDKGNSSGSAYLFVRSGTSWSQQAKLTAGDGAASDGFGSAVSLSGEMALVGALNDDDKGSESGSTYVFSRSGTSWSQVLKLTAPDGAAGNQFGSSLAWDGYAALIGAPVASGKMVGAGAAYLLDKLCLKPDGAPGTTNKGCISGFSVDGVCCDTACGGGAKDCQACSIISGGLKDGICGPVITVGLTCRGASDACDVAETCDGVSLTCPADVVAKSGAICRAAAGSCDLSEVCDGTLKTCPGDGFKPASTLCRGATALCDKSENCTGSSATCPADAVAPAGVTCRASAGSCDVKETCTGVTKFCPKDVFIPKTTVCRAATGPCDAQENCTGAGAACPPNGLKPSGATCRAAVGPCDAAEKCDGKATTCPGDALRPANAICRAANTLCDVAEKCSGTSVTCPADMVAKAGFTCRGLAGPCDIVEICSGTSKYCPPNAFKGTSTICRAKGGVCDLAETCSGKTAACPGDKVTPAGTSCRATTGFCDPFEACNGMLKTCPKDLYKPNGTSCNSGSGICVNGKCKPKPDGGVPDSGPDARLDKGADGTNEAGAKDSGKKPDQNPTQDNGAKDTQPEVNTTGLHYLGGHGCSMGSGPSAPTGLALGLLLLLWTRMRLRRRGAARSSHRRRWGLLFISAAVMSAAAPAWAQHSQNIVRFRPAASRDQGFYVTEGGQPVPHLAPAAGLYLSYAHRPLHVLNETTDKVTADLIKYQVNMNLQFAIGLWDRIELGIGLPITVAQDSDDLTLLGHAPGKSVGSGFGDIRIIPKVRIATLGPIALAAAIPFTAPTGSEEDFLGEDGATVTPTGVVSLDTGRVNAGINFGYRARNERTFTLSAEQGPIQIDDEVVLSAGVKVAVINKRLDLLADVFLTISTHEQDREEVPAEILAGARIYLPRGFIADVGAGPGLTSGAGTPVFRVLAGVGYQYKADEPPPPATDPDPDGDGILGDKDRCPGVAEDMDGFEDEDGCPDLDNDKDGIPDLRDKCPLRPEDMDGFEDEDGCPDLDNDKDGIPDLRDKCPLKPEDMDGIGDEDGCPETDFDNDRILDPDDKCPTKPEVYNKVDDEDGCPDESNAPVRIKHKHIKVPPVYFAFDKDIILEKSYPLLRLVAEVIKANDWIKKLRVEGHTDDLGVGIYNLDLSERRAASVVRFLVNEGIAASRLESLGLGETKPAADNESPTGRAKNRRVIFLITDPKLE